MQERLQEVRTLLDRQKRVESLVHRQEMPRHELVETLVAKQHHNELTKKLDAMHPADIAYVLEALPPDERLIVWNLGAGLYYMMVDKGRTNRTVKSLSWRIGLSGGLILLVVAGIATGVIQPHGVGR